MTFSEWLNHNQTYPRRMIYVCDECMFDAVDDEIKETLKADSQEYLFALSSEQCYLADYFLKEEFAKAEVTDVITSRDIWVFIGEVK